MPASPVSVERQSIILPTYAPHAPDRNPMFFERRVYQGSSGRVYPLPCTDRIEEKPQPRSWNAVVIQNDFISVMILPELGGRIHRAQDKTNGYDFIYYQPVIKPALVGLAGPWASGGIEFNWPQHHRPSTFMPTDVAIEKHPDGSATVWLSAHDPMARMKGMHGVRLHPDKSYLELAVRVYNRTADIQTFLWWANVATRVHEQYQSFFPPDTTHVADHAKRATSTYPLCDGIYYGVDYGARARNGIPWTELPRQFPPAQGLKVERVDPNALNHRKPKSSALGSMRSTPAILSATGLSILDSQPPPSPRNEGASPHHTGQHYQPNDLSWYANIPVPTSYMCMGSQQDFAGGYDHKARAGLVHIANHHISPGKKQWTWGNHEFGYAWDRNLTDPDETGEYAPYIELMAGVYTDNQPDFSYLQPGETKSFSQYWYPIRLVGPVQRASREAAISLRIANDRAHLGVAVTSALEDAMVRMHHAGRIVGQWTQSISPDRPFLVDTVVGPSLHETDFTVTVATADGEEVLSYSPTVPPPTTLPPPAVAPPAPAAVASNDELLLIGQHLEQYRHATRQPDLYWREALRRDPGDSRCHLALGRWHLRRGELRESERHLRACIARLVERNPNPADGEAFYQLGRCLRLQADANGPDSARKPRRSTRIPVAPTRDHLLGEAYAAFYKSTWNHGWQPAGFHALAEIDALRGDWATALDHVTRAVRLNADNLRARNLQVVILRRLGRDHEATSILAETVALDPLDWWARFLQGGVLACDHQVRLDLALDHARAGLFAEALEILAEIPPPPDKPADLTEAPPMRLPDASLGTKPLVHYYRGWICDHLGDVSSARRHRAAAAKADPDFCFPARLEEIAILQQAIAANPRDARAPFYLGNLLYDRRRHDDAITLWEQAVKLEPRNAVAWRNLGLGYHNIRQRPTAARRAYARAVQARPNDARLLYERDQLGKRLGDSPAKRLRELNRKESLVRARDDLSVELGVLWNQLGKPERALPIVTQRRFQPWEGGEGQALGLHVRTHLALGRRALGNKDAALAIRHFESALGTPENLGEARHLLANESDIQFWLGCARADLGDASGANAAWLQAANAVGDFQAMSVRTFSEVTYYSALALDRLGRKAEARRSLRALLNHARALAKTPATTDYFATSLPSMLLFNDDPQARQLTSALFLEAQARLGLGQIVAAKKLLRAILRRDPNHSLAADLLGGIS